MTASTPVVDCSKAIPDDLVKIEDITEQYPGFSRSFLIRQIEARRLCAYKVGGRWFISQADFAAYVTAGRNV